jgi:hypothetical protein
MPPSLTMRDSRESIVLQAFAGEGQMGRQLSKSTKRYKGG